MENIICCTREKKNENNGEREKTFIDTEDMVDNFDFGEQREYRKNEILCYVQISILCLIVLACTINLTLQNGDQTAWTGLLATALGILLPQPGFVRKIKIRHNRH